MGYRKLEFVAKTKFICDKAKNFKKVFFLKKDDCEIKTKVIKR